MGSDFVGTIAMSLRVIVAITLVAAALSAPTWTKQLNNMKVHELEPAIVRTSSLYTAGSGSNPADGGETANCNCVGCSYHYWDSDRDQARDYTKTQCFDDCVAQAKCKFALHDTAIPLNGNRTSAVHGTDPNKVTHKCWLYEHVPTNFQSTDNKVAAHASGGSHYTCFAKTTSAPVTLDPTSPSPIAPSPSSPASCSAFASYNSDTTYTVYQSSSDNYYNYCHHFTTLATAACKSAFCSGGGSSACANEC